ncbi:DNA primase [soil metagenome]
MAADAVSEVRQRLDIVDLVGEKVALKRAGRNMKGLCPFHQEKTPSFVVFPESQNFHCFGCGKGGDLFTFYMDSEKVDFRDALSELAGRAGVSLETMAVVRPQDDPHRKVFMELHQVAAAYFATVLRSSKAGEKGREYLRQRGVSDEMIEQFGLGLAPDGWDFLVRQLSARGADPEAAADAGLLQRRDSGGYYDRFRDRIIFPIQEPSGQVVGFGGRAFGDEQPKYLNTPQSPIFDKSSLLYGLAFARDAIREENQVVIVEGYMDVIAAHQFGFNNVVGAMGTALTESQVDPVKRLTKRVVLALDADTAGQMASLRAIETLHGSLDHIAEHVPGPRGMLRIAQRLDAEVGIAGLDAGLDPDALIRDNPQRWRDFIANAKPYVAFVIDHVLSEVNREDANAKRRAVDRLGPMLQRIAEPVQRDHYILRISRELNLQYTMVQSIVRQSSSRPNLAFSQPQESEVASGRQLRAEDHIMALSLRYTSVVADLIETIPEAVIADSRNRLILQVLSSIDLNSNHETEDILAMMDEHTAEHGRGLVSHVSGRPAPMPGEVREEILQSVVKLQRDQFDALSAHLRAEIAAAQETKDGEASGELLSYLARLPELHQQLYPRRSPYFRDSRSNAEERHT